MAELNIVSIATQTNVRSDAFNRGAYLLNSMSEKLDCLTKNHHSFEFGAEVLNLYVYLYNFTKYKINIKHEL